MNFSIGESVRWGWNTFWKRAWFFIGVTIITGVITTMAGQFTSSGMEGGGGAIVVVGAGFFVSFIVGILVKMGVINLSLKAHDSVDAVRFEDLWAPARFISFIMATIVVGAIVVVGLILLIVPGIIFALRYSMVRYLIMDKGLDAMAALKESARITYGYKWKLLGFVITLALINLLGALCLLVGLLVSIPVSTLAFVHAYRTLARS